MTQVRPPARRLTPAAATDGAIRAPRRCGGAVDSSSSAFADDGVLRGAVGRHSAAEHGWRRGGSGA